MKKLNELIKNNLVIVVVATAIISSGLTVGVIKIVENMSFGDSIYIISDKRCKNCNTDRIVSSLQKTFPGIPIEVIDYNDSDGQDIYEEEKLELLPFVLLPDSVKATEGYKKVSRFAKPGKNYIHVKTGGKFNPTAEICDNSKDDNSDGKIDCEDPTCKTAWECMEKRDKPDVDVFVMSHCPYGTQIEKGIMPVWDLLGDKVNLNIRFCDYAMHKKMEIDEQLKQYCIQKTNKNQFKRYLKCFLKDGNTNRCLAVAGVNRAVLNNCVAVTDRQFKVTANFNDKSKWNGRFPKFDVNADLAKKYGVKGSPKLVINDALAKTGRDAQSLLDAICLGFKVKPAECNKKLNSTKPSPGFDKKPKK